MMKLFLPIVVLFTFFAGCTREKNELLCEIHSDESVPVRYVGNYRSFPCFSPGPNAEEVLFLEHRDSLYESDAYIVFDRLTGEKRVLLDAEELSRPRWNIEGVLYAHNGNIRLAQSGWTSQVTQSGNCTNPEWHFDNVFIYLKDNAANNVARALSYSDVVSISETQPVNSWQHDSLAIIANEYRLRIGNPYLDNFRTIIELDSSVVLSHESSAEWVNDSILVWANGMGIYRVNIKNQNMTPLFRDDVGLCPNRVFMVSDYSKVLDKLLLVRKDKMLKEEHGIKYNEVKITFLMISPDGTGEEVLDIPN